MSEPQKITHSLCPEKERLNFLPTLVAGNARFMMAYEQAVYNFMNTFTQHYQGGYWDFVVFSNGARAMLFKLDEDTKVECENDDNYFDGNMSLRALSLACNLMTCSHLSFTAQGETQEVLGRNYHLLRQVSFEHELFVREASEIWGLLD